MKRLLRIANFLTGICFLCSARTGFCQAVTVTASLDAHQLAAGQNTTLHVYAQVVPSLRTNADRIFSWYVDLVNTNGVVANANYGALVKLASDNIAEISSSGFSVGYNRRGIYDTFLNLPGAGTTNPVELLSVPVTALAGGTTRFLVSAGTGVAQLSADFLVAPLNGGDPWVGGDYSAAVADLQVGVPPCQPQLQITSAPGNRLQLTFTPCPNYDNYVDFTTALSSPPVWQPVPGGPFNSGSLVVSNSATTMFYRIRLETPGSKVKLQIAALSGNRFQLSFAPQSGYDHFVEYATPLGSPSNWQLYPGGPFNSGSVNVSNTLDKAFYRLRLQKQ